MIASAELQLALAACSTLPSSAEREDKNRGRISASQNSEIFEYSFGVF